MGCASQPSIIAGPSQPSVQQLDLQAQHLESLVSINSFQLNGRIAVQMEKQGFSAVTQWLHAPNQDVMEVFSPFGSKLAAINRTDKNVTLTMPDQKQLQASTVEALTEEALGFKLPLVGLSDWALGRPSLQGEAPTMTQYDEMGRIAKLNQQGWDIEYSDYQPISNVELPKKILLKSLKLNMKVLVESWQLDPVKKLTQ